MNEGGGGGGGKVAEQLKLHSRKKTPQATSLVPLIK